MFSQHVCIRYLPPWGEVMCDSLGQHSVITDLNTLADKGVVSPGPITLRVYSNYRPVSEPTELMFAVSPEYLTIGGLLLLYIFAGSSFQLKTYCATWDPAWPDFSLSLSWVQHAAKKIPPTRNLTNRCPEELLWLALTVTLQSPRGCQSSHWWWALQMTVNCLTVELAVRGVSFSYCWLSSC